MQLNTNWGHQIGLPSYLRFKGKAPPKLQNHYLRLGSGLA